MLFEENGFEWQRNESLSVDRLDELLPVDQALEKARLTGWTVFTDQGQIDMGKTFRREKFTLENWDELDQVVLATPKGLRTALKKIQAKY